MSLGMFMAILDIQVVATSLPTIQSALGISADWMVWVQTAYLTAEIVAIPLTGYLTARLGMRWLFVGAVCVFTLASLGCALSQSFEQLIAWRIVQGFSGGTLIPSVFAAVFLLFPERSQALATTIAGVAAVLAPTVGPIVGGWITQSFSWHWLFMINIVPGVVVGAGVALTLRGKASERTRSTAIDVPALALLAMGLTALQLGLKDAPSLGWDAPRVLGLLGLFAACGAAFVWRTLASRAPLVELRCFSDRNFAIGCVFSFVLGFGLFGSTYLMPFFLGLVREHGPLRIGEIMLVTGITQLLTAPIAVYLERRLDPRLLTAFGFSLFAVGLLMSGEQTAATDFWGMFAPQIVRGAAIMFCILPPTRMALGRLPPHLVVHGSGLFNLMRNLGGAIGLALIDTTIFSRAATEGNEIVDKLRSGDLATALAIGIPRDAFLEQRGQPLDEFALEMIRPLVEKAGLVSAINSAWLLCGILTMLAVTLIVFVRRVSPAAKAANAAVAADR
ncbi:DHA2 family efflux MFS transporter permease subunit [Sphingomonas sp. HDW15A]|uniref:DHA2 family efflux MFS transporter permease subunit n=1 Tax=Sphingomonas sp. HDW15A TaxID=2714942 RepID=UPI00140C4ED6|nr:DHA2 family efflux MFS transporter permease subunit [Sphingomonas sp. HDW15A]QIK97238.1 DHA2 family efflux MFS transporter permease subunit [Sphingomonas sp. HDW15A]